MAIQIISEEEKALKTTGDYVTLKELKQLVKNYHKRTKKKSKSGQYEDIDVKKDSRSAWFSMSKILELMKQNGMNESNVAKYGLRIYFGIHDDSVVHTPYDNQQTVILVATKNIPGGKPDDDQTSFNSFVEIAGFGTVAGLNHGKLCPPADDCGMEVSDDDVS